MALPEGCGRPHDYGSCRVCEGDGCDTVLSRYNPGRFCAACAAKRRRPPATEEETVSTSPKAGDRERVLEELRKGEPWSRGNLAQLLDITPRSVAQHVSRLNGEHEIAVTVDDGEPWYSYVGEKVEREPLKVLGTGIATETLEPSPIMVAGEALGWSEPQELHVAPDREVAAIEHCVCVLEDLHHAARRRVLTYLGARYNGPDVRQEP